MFIMFAFSNLCTLFCESSRTDFGLFHHQIVENSLHGSAILGLGYSLLNLLKLFITILTQSCT